MLIDEVLMYNFLEFNLVLVHVVGSETFTELSNEIESFDSCFELTTHNILIVGCYLLNDFAATLEILGPI